MQLPNSNYSQQQHELASLLPFLLSADESALTDQLEKYGIMNPDLELACYELYDLHGIDPLLEIHPMRASFYQMELSKDRFSPAEQQNAPIQKEAKKDTALNNQKDYIRLSKDHLQLFIAIALAVLLLLQLLPKS